MSSDQNTSLEEADGVTDNPNTSHESLTPSKNPSEKHSKGRRRKRGLKKQHKQPRGSAAQPESENHAESSEPQQSEAGPSCSPDWDSDEVLDSEINSYNDVMIRPVNVPKAPENSTQFIMDDHNECVLYMSFETPNPYLDSDVTDRDAAFFDIDWEYHTQVALDSAYYDREFELSYKNNRFDELLRLSREDLITGLRSLESRLQDLTSLVQENPTSVLEKLQADLLELQEEHILLKQYNVKLSSMLYPEKETVSADSTEDKLDPHYGEGSNSHLKQLCEGNPEVQNTLSGSIYLNSEAEASESVINCDSNMETEPCQSSVIHSCSEAVSVNEQTDLSHLNIEDENSCDELPHSTVSDDHELNAVTV